MTAQTLFLTRSLSMGGAGLVCGIYGVLVLIQGRPDPLSPWIPGIAGVVAAIAIFIAASNTAQKTVNAIFDEGYRADCVLAQRIGFWVAVWLYPIFAVPLYMGWITGPSAFAAMGTLTAATYLIGTVVLDMRGR